jgi:hypothetical protein
MLVTDPLLIVLFMLLGAVLLKLYQSFNSPFHVRLGVSEQEWESWKQVLQLDTYELQAEFVEQVESRLGR